MKLKADLHLHTALSPCGSLDNSPSAVVKQAKACGLDVIAITDHNAMENCFYAEEIAKKEGIKLLQGMEAQTMEDVHILCYFDDRKKAESFYTDAYNYLPDLENNAEYFGDQVVVDSEDNVVRFENKLLINSLNLSIGELVEKVKLADGFVVPAHVDSEKYGLMFNMGFVPLELRDVVMELSYNAQKEKFLDIYPGLSAFPIITNSDAHYLPDIGRGYTIYNVRGGTRLLPAIYDAARERNFQTMKPNREK
jgi:PHP family Zn ribbon phosphoesterase